MICSNFALLLFMFSEIGLLAWSLLDSLTINYTFCSNANKNVTKSLKAVWIVKDLGEISLVKWSIVKRVLPYINVVSRHANSV